MQLSNKPVTPCVFSHGHDDLNDLLRMGKQGDLSDSERGMVVGAK